LRVIREDRGWGLLVFPFKRGIKPAVTWGEEGDMVGGQIS